MITNTIAANISAIKNTIVPLIYQLHADDAYAYACVLFSF
jgi:hypothetical protein